MDRFAPRPGREDDSGFRSGRLPAICGRTMTLALTSSLAAIFIAIALLAAWRGARPFNPLKGPRMIPWRMIMLLSAALTMLMLVHVLNLVGVTTGRGQR